jgi:hypothetical protein
VDKGCESIKIQNSFEAPQSISRTKLYSMPFQRARFTSLGQGRRTTSQTVVKYPYLLNRISRQTCHPCYRKKTSESRDWWPLTHLSFKQRSPQTFEEGWLNSISSRCTSCRKLLFGNSIGISTLRSSSFSRLLALAFGRTCE